MSRKSAQRFCDNGMHEDNDLKPRHRKRPIQHLLSARESWFPEAMKGVGDTAGAE